MSRPSRASRRSSRGPFPARERHREASGLTQPTTGRARNADSNHLAVRPTWTSCANQRDLCKAARREPRSKPGREDGRPFWMRIELSGWRRTGLLQPKPTASWRSSVQVHLTGSDGRSERPSSRLCAPFGGCGHGPRGQATLDGRVGGGLVDPEGRGCFLLPTAEKVGPPAEPHLLSYRTPPAALYAGGGASTPIARRALQTRESTDQAKAHFPCCGQAQ